MELQVQDAKRKGQQMDENKNKYFPKKKTCQIKSLPKVTPVWIYYTYLL